MKFILSSIMLIIGVFLMQPAYANNVSDTPVIMAGNWVLVEMNFAQPYIDEVLPMVAPANLPGHLNYTKFSDFANKLDLNVAGMVILKKGGFQNVEIVRLTKLRYKIPLGKKSSTILDLAGSLV